MIKPLWGLEEKRLPNKSLTIFLGLWHLKITNYSITEEKGVQSEILCKVVTLQFSNVHMFVIATGDKF